MAASDNQIKPPKLACHLLGMMTPTRDKAAILGDMDEGFREKYVVSPEHARKWYWQQTFKSLPYLFWHRITSHHVKAIGVILIMTFVGYTFIHFWDMFVARSAAQYVAKNSTAVPLEHIRKLYFLIYMVGATIVGAIIASTLFSKHRSYIVNVFLFIGPVAAIVFTDSFLRFLLADTPNALTYFLQRVGLAFPALALGAFIVMRLRGVSDK